MDGFFKDLAQMVIYYGVVKPYLVHPGAGALRFFRDGAVAAGTALVADAVAREWFQEGDVLLGSTGTKEARLITALGLLGTAVVVNLGFICAIQQTCSGSGAGSKGTYCHCTRGVH